MIYTFSINIPTIQDIKDSKYTVERFLYRKLLKIDAWLFKRYGKWFWKLIYKYTKRCGSLMYGHSPILGNRSSWLWEKKRKYIICSICGLKYKIPSKPFISYKNYSDKGRQADAQTLNVSLKTATNESERNAVKHAMHKLNNETPLVKSMREELIKATRDNDHTKIKQIHEDIAGNKKYQNE